ncbi:MAG: endonuclease/exonuclease/phosphatase family protein [Halanaerobiaceae bacterium]
MKFKILFLLMILIFIAGGLVSWFFWSKPIYISDSKISIPEGDGKDTAVMTYNIQRGLDMEGNSNLPEISELISGNKFDIVGLNEVDRYTRRSGFQNQIKTLASSTGMNYVYGPNVDMIPGSYGNALLTRHRIISAENHTLPGFDKSEKRGLLNVKIQLPDGEVYNVLVTHLSLNRQERQLQLSWIEDYLDELKKPYFLLGDFNGQKEFSSSLRPLIDGQETFPAHTPSGQIDYIISDLNIELAEKGTFRVPFSDHLPLYIKSIL